MSWPSDLTKAQRRELRRIVGLAYDRELAKALTALEDQFRRWRAGELGPHELNEVIHTFHEGPNRQLWSRYSHGPVELFALDAVRNGIVSETEVEPDTLAILRPRLDALE